VVGFILIVLITIMFIGLVQSVMLPQWNKAIEVEHSERMSYDVAKMREAVTLSAISGKGSMVSLKAGISYPDRPFLISPKFASATISAEELSISVKSDQINFKERTRAIIISPNYYYSLKPRFTFEHTAAFRSYENQLVVISDQSSFQKSSVNVYLINTTFDTIAVTQPVNTIFKPVSYGGRVFVDDAWINFTTTNPEYWNETLSKISDEWTIIRDSNTISVNVKNVYLSMSYLIAQVSTAGSAEINVTLQPYDIRRVGTANYILTVGEAEEFSAMVVDEFGNPVPNVYVEFDASGGALDKSNSTTDDGGMVSVFFTGVTTTNSGYVRFSCPDCTNISSIQYSLSITEPETSGAYRINWEKDEYIAAGSEGQTTEIEMRANTTPKAIYATVEFVTDNPNAVFNPRQTLTDSAGNATTTLQITPQPDWDWLTIIGAFATTLASGDMAVVKFYLTKIWVVDIYEDFINGIFQNTQLIGSPGQDSQVILEQNTANWLSGWSFRLPITVSSSSDLFSYQVLVTIDTASLISAGKMRSDCGDIRFTQSDGTSKLNYWIESGCNSGATRIWVKTDLISGNNLIYMYYGNEYATPESSLSTTFDTVGETGVVSVGGSETTVNLANTYTDPVVLAVPRLVQEIYRSGTPSAQHHLITEVSNTHFRIKQVELPSGGEGTIDSTQISYIVLEKGVYYIGTNLLAEIDTVTARGWYNTSISKPPSHQPQQSLQTFRNQEV